MTTLIQDDFTGRGPNHASDACRGTKILLTGATGFLGAELLVRLLARRTESIVCLVRADSETSAASRGHSSLARVLGREPTACEAARIEWLRADLELPGLGLDAAQRTRLAREIDEIFHCAASTRFDLPLAESERTNVHGLTEIYAIAREACADHSFRRLHHVSTAYVSGVMRGRVDACDLPADGKGRFRNNYERSKARAERFLRNQDLVPFTIYRPSIIVGDSHSGRTLNWNVIYPILRLIEAGLLPFFPTSGKAPLDIVPIDFVADGILGLGERADSAGETFHLTAGQEELTIREFLSEAYRGVGCTGHTSARVRTRFLSPLKWWMLRSLSKRGIQRFSRMSRREFSARRRLVTAIEMYAPYGRVRCHFDARREHALLREIGVRMPQRHEFLGRVFNYALANRFGLAGRASQPAPLVERQRDWAGTASPDRGGALALASPA